MTHRHSELDSVQQYATGTGVGALTLGAATSAKFRRLETLGFSDGDTLYARIQHETIDAEWEIVLLTYNDDGQIERTFDDKSSSSTGNLIAFSTGNKIVSAAGVAAVILAATPDGDITIERNFTQGGTEWSIGDGFFIDSTQPTTAYADMVVPLNGTTYVDNVLTLQNNSVRADGQRGNAAIRLKDGAAETDYERAAFGYSSTNANSFLGGCYAYIGIGDIGPPGDNKTTNFAISVDNAAGVVYFPGAHYNIMDVRTDTNMVSFRNHLDVDIVLFDTEAYQTSFYGPDAATYLTLIGGDTGEPFTLAAGGTDSTVLLRLNDKAGAGVALGSNGNYALIASNVSASAVNYLKAKGAATGLPVGMEATGTDSAIGFRIDDKGGGGVALASRGNFALLASNASASAVNYLSAAGSATGLPVVLSALGSDSTILLQLQDKGGAGVALASNGAYGFVVENPASPVNYLKATGSAAGLPLTLSAIGTDSVINVRINDKAGGGIALASRNNFALLVSNSNNSAVNYVTAIGSPTGDAVVLGAAGSDTNIDLALVPQAAGLLKYGTHAALSGETVTGYVTFKTAEGTTRKLAVVS